MAVNWRGPAAQAALDDEIGKRLLRMAVTVQTGLMQRMGRHNPPPYKDSSKPGEYLKNRTTYLLKRVMYEPTTAAAVAKEGRVRVGYERGAPYGAIWELKPAAQRRKGLVDAVEELRGQLAKLAGG